MVDTGSGFLYDYLVILISVIIGATVLLLVYITSLSSKGEEAKNGAEAEVVKEKKQHKEGGSAGVSKSSKKKQHGTERWARDSKQSFSHPWLLTSLKGHSGQVLDMDFSSNGKYLATCAEEGPDPGGGHQGGDGSSGSSSGSEGNKENRATSVGGSHHQGSKRTGGGLLSRRQKKNNRVRRDDSSPSSSRSSSGGGKKGGGSNRTKKTDAPLRQHTKLNLNDSDLSVFLRHYILSPDQLLGLGYPVESALYPGRAIIYKNPSHSLAPLPATSHLFDVNAREFVPKQQQQQQVPPPSSMYISDLVEKSMGYGEWSNDKKNSEDSNTPDMSQSDKESSAHSSPDLRSAKKCTGQKTVPNVIHKSTEEKFEVCDSRSRSSSSTTEEDFKDTDANTLIDSSNKEEKWSGSDERKCVRCGRGFFVTRDGEYLTQERCLYHWGKLQRSMTSSARTEYSCCKGRPSARGCTTGRLHVWNGVAPGINGPLDGYVRTRMRKNPPPDGNFGVYALDCEMCFTTRGLELTKVTVVAPDGRLVYDCLVRPENFIIDYNTRFSGITARDLNAAGNGGKRGGSSNPPAKSLRDVQNDLMGFINADTILIGHGLENDLRALRIIHGTVIDTSVIFPHYYGLPYRRSLKSLVGCFLRRKIQQDASGHDSFEDARACVELMLWRIRKDFRAILENRSAHILSK